MATLPSRLAVAVHQVVRAELRMPALARGRLEREGAPAVRVTLRNASPSGFMAIASEPVPAGSRVTLVLPLGAPVAADVRWSLNRQIGCRLDARFGRGQLAMLTLLGAGRGIGGGAAAAILGCALLALLG